MVQRPPTDNDGPFGGMKMSGNSRELGPEGLEAFRRPSTSTSTRAPTGSRGGIPTVDRVSLDEPHRAHGLSGRWRRHVNFSGPRRSGPESQTVRVQPTRVQRIHGRRAATCRVASRRTRRRFYAELPFLLIAALILTVLVAGSWIQALLHPLAARWS